MKILSATRVALLGFAVTAFVGPALAQTSSDRPVTVAPRMDPQNPGARGTQTEQAVTNPGARQDQRGSALVDHPDDSLNHH